MRTMYDAVTARNILGHDQTPEIVAGYVDRIKLAPWTAADWALFPSAVKVRIVKKASTNDGHVLDVEPGDATPAEAPAWVRMRRAAGADPTIYVNKSTWPLVQAEFDRQHVEQPHYWIAHYNGDPALPTLNGITAVAKQHTANYRGVDINSVADYWPGVDGDDIVTPEDIKAIAAACGQAAWDAPVQNKSNGQVIPARELAGWTLRGVDVANDRLNAVAARLTDLALKVAAQQNVPVADLVAGLLAGLLPEVKAELADVEHLDETAVADRLAANLTARLAQ